MSGPITTALRHHLKTAIAIVAVFLALFTCLIGVSSLHTMLTRAHAARQDWKKEHNKQQLEALKEEFEMWKRLYSRPDARLKDWYWIVKVNQPAQRMGDWYDSPDFEDP